MRYYLDLADSGNWLVKSPGGRLTCDTEKEETQHLVDMLNELNENPNGKSLPTETEIEDTLQKLQDRLEEKAMSLSANAAVKEGYEESVDILADDRRTYAGIDKLKTTQGRVIAVLAVDYLNGECTAEVLLGVPLKEVIGSRLKR
jgi:hypothetical protein